MIIKCIGGPADGQGINVPLTSRGEPPETVIAGIPDTDGDVEAGNIEFYRVHRCNDPFSESWWWAYVVTGLVPADITEAQIAASRPEET